MLGDFRVAYTPGPRVAPRLLPARADRHGVRRRRRRRADPAVGVRARADAAARHRRRGVGGLDRPDRGLGPGSAGADPLRSRRRRGAAPAPCASACTRRRARRPARAGGVRRRDPRPHRAARRRPGGRSTSRPRRPSTCTSARAATWTSAPLLSRLDSWYVRRRGPPRRGGVIGLPPQLGRPGGAARPFRRMHVRIASRRAAGGRGHGVVLACLALAGPAQAKQRRAHARLAGLRRRRRAVRHGDRAEGLRQPAARHARRRRREVAGDRSRRTGSARCSSTSAVRARSRRPTSRRTARTCSRCSTSASTSSASTRAARTSQTAGLHGQPGDAGRLLEAVHDAGHAERRRAAAQGHALHRALHPAQRRPAVHVDRERRARLRRGPRGGRRQEDDVPRVLVRDVPRARRSRACSRARPARSCSTARWIRTST